VELLSRVARLQDAILGVVPGLAGMHDVDDFPAAEQVSGGLSLPVRLTLVPCQRPRFHRHALPTVERYSGDLSWFVLNVEDFIEVDITGRDALESVRAR
jgi:SulP family sulfate permease